jgi:CheY-like chemotaxis protein
MLHYSVDDESEAGNVHLNPQHVLVVDDDNGQRMVLASMLRQLGCTTTEASDPKIALEILEADPSITLVFTDVLLPWMSGISFLERVREARPTLPVVVISASDYSLWGEQAMQKGAIFCLQIPFFRRDLIAALEAAQAV